MNAKRPSVILFVFIIAALVVLCFFTVPIFHSHIDPGPASVVDIGPDVQSGDVVTFGHYPHTEAGDDSTPIEWLVLDVQADRVLLISRYGLDVKPYNALNTDITWENSTLRAWLNSVFLDNAFSADERTAILVTDVDNSIDQGYGKYKYSTDVGGNTLDSVFLLSWAEANRYFGVRHSDVWGFENTKACMEPTAYAVKKGTYPHYSIVQIPDGPYAAWWLRSPGFENDRALLVLIDGNVYYRGVAWSACVRPALWLNLEAGVF